VAKNRFKLLVAVVCAGTISIFAEQSVAQAPNAQDVERANLLQGQTQPPFGPGSAPEGFEDGHAVASPNDADIGAQEILKAAPQYLPFTVSLATPVFYTSNVALTPNNEKGDVVFAPAVGAFYDPQLTRTLYAHLGALEQVFYYGKYTTFDFGSLDCQAGLSYFVPEAHNLLLRAWYDFNRLTSGDRLGDEFFSNHGIILNAEVPFQFGRAQQIWLGGDANLSVGADHQFPRRNDYEGYIGYSADITRAFSVHVVGRVVDRDYHQNGRNDVSEIISAAATYRVASWCWVSAIGSFAHSDSNQDQFDYDVGNAGGGLELSLRF
jgi:hypothetical protein